MTQKIYMRLIESEIVGALDGIMTELYVNLTYLDKSRFHFIKAWKRNCKSSDGECYMK